MKLLPRRTFLWLLVFIPSGISQTEVRSGSVGGEVLLPCIAPDDVPNNKLVLWRDGRDQAVVNIKNREHTFIAPRFQGRLSDSSSLRNFSIRMKDLRVEDADTYQCNIPDLNFSSTVRLNVTGGEQNKGTTAAPGSGAAAVRVGPLGVALASLLSLLL